MPRAAGTTTMITTMTTTIDHIKRPALLRLLAWLSPAFPTGGFAYSHGLEWAVETGDVKDEASLLLWLTDVLGLGSGRTDVILLRMAHRASVADISPPGSLHVAEPAGASTAPPMSLVQVAELAIATAPSAERQAEALAQGRAFALAAIVWGGKLLPEILPYPVAVGAQAGAHGIGEDDSTAAFLQAFAANLISAAVRLVPLGQTAGLRVLAALEPVILATMYATRGAGPDDLGGCAFRSDLASMRHETQYTRLFRS
jgi:urease accessory protein